MGEGSLLVQTKRGFLGKHYGINYGRDLSLNSQPTLNTHTETAHFMPVSQESLILRTNLNGQLPFVVFLNTCLEHISLVVYSVLRKECKQCKRVSPFMECKPLTKQVAIATKTLCSCLCKISLTVSKSRVLHT